MRKIIYLGLVIAAFCTLTQAQENRGPSTPEERQRMVALVHKLEDTPQDESLRPEIRWGLRWLEDVPDISVTICIAPFGKFWDAKYKYAPDHFAGIYTFAQAAFLIEHPDKAGDKNAQYTAGMEGVLKAYSSILKDNPDAHSKELDDLLQKQKDGKLPDFVRDESKKKCK